MRARRLSFWFLLSSLLARLSARLQVSRLTIFRVKEKVVINRIRYSDKSLPICTWLVQEDKLYCLGFREADQGIFVRETRISKQ